MVEGLTKAVGIASTIGTDMFLMNVVKNIESDDTSASEKLVNRLGCTAISGLIGTAIVKGLTQMGETMLEQHERSMGIEVIGRIED